MTDNEIQLNNLNYDSRRVANKLYKYYPDQFDHINEWVPRRTKVTYRGDHVTVSNNIENIGQGIYSNSTFYGSQKRLKGYNRIFYSSLY